MATAIMLLVPSCKAANHPPIITSLKAEPGVVYPSGSCQVECITSDNDSDELSYEWLVSKGNIDGDGATVTWNAPDSEGIYNIVIKVTDGNGGEVIDYITITVRVNNPPTITSLKADVDWVTPSSGCRIECNAEDPDDDELSYEWSANGGDISGTGSVITWTAPDAVGLYNVEVVVTDGSGEEDTRSLTVSVAQDQPPIIEDLVVTPKGHKYLKEYTGGYKVLKGKSYEIECIASDPEGGELSYEWSASGGELSGEGAVITWTAPLQGGKVTVAVAVSDGRDVASKSIVFNVKTCASCAF